MKRHHPYNDRSRNSSTQFRLLYNATSKDAMKLRMTGFERSPSFVIRLGIEASAPESGWGPPSDDQACLGISCKFDEFPNLL